MRKSQSLHKFYGLRVIFSLLLSFTLILPQPSLWVRPNYAASSPQHIEAAKQRLKNYKDTINAYLDEVLTEMNKGDASKEYVVDLLLGYYKYIDSSSGWTQAKILKDNGVDLEGADMRGWLEDYNPAEKIVNGETVAVHSAEYVYLFNQLNAAQEEFKTKFQEETDVWSTGGDTVNWTQKYPKEIDNSKPETE
jgi:hypothetical protein